MNVFPERVTDDKGSARIEGGITLRDYYAAAALTGILSNPDTPQNTPYYVSADAYRLADAMLEARGS